MADLFAHLNERNISIQGSGGNIIPGSEKLTAFIHKLPVWKRRVEKCNFANFPTLEGIIVDEDEQEDMSHVDQICTHLDGLMTSFDDYSSYGDLNVASGGGWIRDPFLFNFGFN